MNPEDLNLTGDQALDARNVKRLNDEIARLKKNQDRRLQRKNAQIIKAGGTPLGGDMYVKSETVRKPSRVISWHRVERYSRCCRLGSAATAVKSGI